MSKLPNHTIWARAATTSATASTSTTRASSILAKTHQHGSSSAIASSSHRKRLPQNQTHSSSSSQSLQHYPSSAQSPDPVALAAMGAVTAPYQGPQPAAVADVLEQQSTYVHHHQQWHANDVLGSSVGTFSNPTSSINISHPVSFPSLSALSQALMAGSRLRTVAGSTNLPAPRPLRPLHQWSHAQTSPSIPESPLSAATTKHLSMRKARKPRLLFDVSEAAPSTIDGKGKSAAQIGVDAEIVQHLDKADELLASLWSSRLSAHTREGDEHFNHSKDFKIPFASTRSVLFTPSNPFLSSETGLYPDSASAVSSSHSPAQSRSPSPDTSDGGRPSDVGHRSPFGHVSEPPAKFAVTTSAQGHVTSPSSSDGSDGKSSELQYVAATSSASSTAGASSAAPPQASSPAGSTDHWAKTFNIPRSAKRHDFMFEHGAYGIPKRHPLSSIRASTSAPSSKSERSAPTREEVPSGKVRAATDMLSAAADFFAGSQRSGMAKDEFTPFNGQDALQAALAGGSTAQEYELRSPSKDLSKAGKDGRSSGVHDMAIRGPDGRIIKERLRSVQVGEDAYFLRPDALGVADGVGGWASRPGADPALFSRLLMHFCAVELSRYDGLSAAELAADNGSLLKAWASVDPVEVMHRAWQRCVRASRREGILGSSTALIGLLRGDELRIANMGDCVLMIIRCGEMMFRSTEQQHSFNFPVQLGMMGDTTDTIKKHIMATQEPRERAAAEGEVASGPMEDYDAVEGETSETARNDDQAAAAAASQLMPEREGNEEFEPEWDEPRRDAGRWAVRVEAGDIIVVGSDGLMDNLFDEDIIEEVLRFLPGGQGDQQNKLNASNFSPQLVSEALCSRAKAVSEDSRAISSPFQQRAMEEGLNYVGGKHDDISVLVCVVGERDGLELDAEKEGSEGSASNSDDDGDVTARTSAAKTTKYLIK